MKYRNFSPQEMFIKLAQKHQPVCEFKGNTRTEFKAWKEAVLPRVIATLGDFPLSAKPNPELLVEWQDDGLLKQRWAIDVGEFISATLQINYPPKQNKGRYPAILCCHGHGQFGKTPVMNTIGEYTESLINADIKEYNYNYGHKMAKKGFITFAIDCIGFGERNDNYKPNNRAKLDGRDWCNLYYLHATMLGSSSLAIGIAHNMAAISFVQGLQQVDQKRIGVMGLSGGGAMSCWMGLCDKRIKATEIICYSDLWACFGVRDLNYCGVQVAPGLFKLVDLPDLQGLHAPDPLLIDIGANDRCFMVDSAMACYNKLKQIYAAAGAGNKLELVLSPSTHAWGETKSEAFFNKYL